MRIGAAVRRMFGRHERLVSELWRAGFVNLDDIVSQIRGWVPNPISILEVGCGEGAATERLAIAYPNACILAVDIVPNLGRLYTKRSEKVTFRQVTLTDLAKSHAGKFDLIVMCDVLHHIPEEMRPDIIAAARTLMAPGGAFVCKDWKRTATLVHWAAYAADRWLTGDRIRYATEPEVEELFTGSFGPSPVHARATIRPWKNNFALLIRPAE